MTTITNKIERVDAMCELIETARELISLTLPDAPYDRLENLAIVLYGGNSPASDRWAKALGRA